MLSLRSERDFARNPNLDPFRPHGFFLEQERTASGGIAETATILLTNKECPWRCAMCDLWKNTLTFSVPHGAIPKQIDFALSELGASPEQVKLYNSGSFFDSAAIPSLDYRNIADRVAFASNLVVESHPRLVGEKTIRLRDLLAGSLEVAMGLETIHPKAFPHLNKRFELDDFARSSEFLRNNNIDFRVFVLVKPPLLNEEEGIVWAVKSARFAFDCGASVVSLIPTRRVAPPMLSSLETAHHEALKLDSGRVFADTWDLEKFSTCLDCLELRRQRLRRINLTQRMEQRVSCGKCDGK